MLTLLMPRGLSEHLSIFGMKQVHNESPRVDGMASIPNSPNPLFCHSPIIPLSPLLVYATHSASVSGGNAEEERKSPGEEGGSIHPHPVAFFSKSLLQTLAGQTQEGREW